MRQLRVLLCAAALGFAGMALAQSDGGQPPVDGNSAPSTTADAGGAPADQTPSAATTGSQAINIQLNKLQTVSNACRAYLVTQNLTDHALASLKLDVVMFDNNGVVAKRLAVQLGPMPAGKTSLKVFDIPGLKCKQIGQLLLNNVLQCTVDTGHGPPRKRDDCLSLISVSQLGHVPFIQ